ncbi:MAG TPA: GGDEF domain-containing protein [Pseudonocardiaceae bacterium]|jgi:diguanylate cyclase (GGDEF)-like protein|nr:GGDEF domain-containing protein [Pseudonocardiaceae bacterium]
MVAVDLLTLVGVGFAVVTAHPAAPIDWARFAVLLGFASLHVFLSRRQEETRRNLMETVHVDLTSIWTFPAALVLPLPQALLLILAVRYQRWFVARRPLYRFVFATAACAVGALAVHGVLTLAGEPVWSGLGVLGSVRDLGVALAAAAAYVVVQAGLVGIAVVLHTARPTLATAVGTWYDNGLEALTVLLGVVTAVLLLHAPAVLVVMVLIGVIGNRFAEIRQLQVDVRTDVKTGLLNMRGWQEAAAKELARADRTGTPTALLMVDLDYFKTINDTWGHPAGDDMLGSVAEVLRTETRPSDLVGRFGGEEFVVLLPDADPAAGAAAAERIRKRIADLTVVTTDKRGGPAVITDRTTSIGVAGMPVDATALAGLLQAADAAVYVAKEGGRNQVRVAGEAGGTG